MNNTNTKHLIDLGSYTNEEILSLLDLGMDIYEDPKSYNQKCSGKILSALFFEPSTRTKFSFESAMLKLGGNLIGFSDANTSSIKKGESIADTIRCISYYSDIAVIRHPKEGTPKLASLYSDIPIINAGDGGHLHPTQTLTDLLTIKRYKKKLDGHVIGLCGDLKYGRTVHSLIKTMARFNTKKFVLISPDELKLPESVKRYISDNYDVEIQEVRYLEDAIDELDILYMTRIQKERFFNEEDYLKLKNTYILNKSKIKPGKEDMIIMHPLPRVNEISYDVDDDKRAVYFEQANMGVYVRMALILKLLEVE